MKDYKDFKTFVNHISEGYDFKNEKQLEDIVNYFGDGETSLDRSKGLLIGGVVGCGKTLFINLVQKWVFKKFCLNPVSSVVSEYNISGEEGVAIFKNTKERMFDDLGIEQIGRYYGSNIEVMQEVIYERYYKKLRTHFTTNAESQALKEKYGLRAYDRIKEMCNVIQWQEDKSYRGNSLFRFKTEEERVKQLTEKEKEEIVQQGMKEMYERWKESGKILGAVDSVYSRLRKDGDLPIWSEEEIKMAKLEAVENITKEAKEGGNIFNLENIIGNKNKVNAGARKVLLGWYYTRLGE